MFAAMNAGPGEHRVHWFFEIRSTPAGEAPLEIREQWLGVVLPVRYPRHVEGPQPMTGAGVETFTLAPYADGVIVTVPDALEALDRAGRSGAAAYWEVTMSRMGGMALIFQFGEGRALPPDLAFRLHPELGPDAAS